MSDDLGRHFSECECGAINDEDQEICEGCGKDLINS